MLGTSQEQEQMQDTRIARGQEIRRAGPFAGHQDPRTLFRCASVEVRRGGERRVSREGAGVGRVAVAVAVAGQRRRPQSQSQSQRRAGRDELELETWAADMLLAGAWPRLAPGRAWRLACMGLGAGSRELGHTRFQPKVALLRC